jgi:hypothetical protein
VVVSDWGKLEPSGALIDTLGTSGPLALATVDEDGATTDTAAVEAAPKAGRFFRAPGGT